MEDCKGDMVGFKSDVGKRKGEFGSCGFAFLTF
jgi:hypothetical protein